MDTLLNTFLLQWVDEEAFNDPFIKELGQYLLVIFSLIYSLLFFTSKDSIMGFLLINHSRDSYLNVKWTNLIIK